MADKSTTAFLDTMIYLHYKPVEEIPWPDVLGAQYVHIMVPRVTLTELDKQKDTNPQRKIQDRARRVLQRLERWGESQPEVLRAGVDLGFIHRVPQVDFAEHGLDSTRNDDKLLATILAYMQENPDHDVVLVTQDTTPRMVARSLGIASTGLPDDLKLPTEADPLEQENRELKKQLETFQRAAPKLMLRFAGEGHGNRLHISLRRPPEDPDQHIAKKMGDLREQYPHLSPAPHEPMRPRWSILEADTPPEEYQRYNRELEEFFTEYEQYKRDTWDRFYREHLTARFQLKLCNDGSAPADDIDLWIHFPDGFRLVTADKLKERREVPRPPRKPRTRIQIMNEQFRSLTAIAQPYLPRIPSDLPVGRPPNVMRPDIRRTDSYDVHWGVQRVKHNQCEDLDALAIIFDSYDEASSFTIDYRIHVSNLPDEIKGQLHVVVEKEEA